MKPRKRLFPRLAFILLAMNIGATYAQQTYTFTSAGATGSVGPTQTQVNTAYSLTPLSGMVTVSAGIQSWTVPSTGAYRIEAAGAQGGNSYNSVYIGGTGATMIGDFTLTVGTVVKILVGQRGTNGSTGYGGSYNYVTSGGGGGGSYVVSNSTLILAAGGGGGGATDDVAYSGYDGNPALVTTTGNVCNGIGIYYSNGSPGSNGNGGTGGSWYAGAGGAGYSGNGGNSSGGSISSGGVSFVNGGGGGAAAYFSYANVAGGAGGFGGGGGACFGAGGGGGYSGGAGGTVDQYAYSTGGGGGGSYNTGLNQVNTGTVHTGPGYVKITRLAGVDIVMNSPINCYSQNTGVLSATVTGGVPPYSYSWSPVGLTTATISNLYAGVYSVTATDANSQVYVNTYTLAEPSLLQNVVASQSSITCYGASNGSISLSVFGGTAPYSYTWYPSGGNSNAATNLAAGTYTAQIRDANNCVSSRVVTLSQPGPITVAGFALNSVVCQGDPTTLVAAGALTYTWSHGVTNGIQFTPTSTQNYTVVGTNSSGCNGQAVVGVTVLPVPNVQISTSNSVICSGNSSNLLASGAVSYTWSTSAINNAITVSPLVNTTYTVSGTNSQGCKNSAVLTITVINSNPPVTANATQLNPCQGNATALFGGGAVTYTWTGGVTNNVSFVPGATASYTVTGSNACGSGTAAITVTVRPLPTISAIPSATSLCFGGTVSLSGAGGVSYAWTGGVSNNVPFTPLSSQNYTVTGTGSNGCLGKATQSIVVNALPIITTNATSTLVCSGNTVMLSGNGALTYTWNNGVTNGLPFSPTATAVYNVAGADANGCIGYAVRSISVTTPPVLTISSTTNAVCQGMPLSLTASGANSYTWTPTISNGVSFVPATSAVYLVQGGNACGTSTASIGITVYSLPSVTAIASSSAVCLNSTLSLTGAGAQTYTWSHSVTNAVPFSPSAGATYTVNGTNANGCSNSATIAVVVHALPNITTTVSAAMICPGGSVTLGGLGAQSYTWTGGVSNSVPFYPTGSAVYTVTGQDANGCRGVATRSIGIYTPPNVTASSSSSAVCLGGSVTLSAFGANTYTWSGGITNGQGFYPSATSSYTVFGTNLSTGCTNTNNVVVTVSVNPLPVITGSASVNVLCQGQSTSLHGMGGTSYIWTGGVINGNTFIPTSNSYTVTGTLNGCSSTGVVSLTVNPTPSVTGVATPAQVCAGGTIMLSASGANTYTWSNGVQNGVAFQPLISGSYQVAGTNTLTGCTSTNNAIVTVTVHMLPTVLPIQSASVVCAGTPVTFSALGAHTFSWSGGIQNNVPFVATTSGVYTVTGTHTVTGCSNTSTVSLVVNPLPVVTLSVSSNVICQGDSVIIVPQGAGSFTYGPAGWIAGVPFKPSTTKTYTATGSNPLTGCKAGNAASVVVTVNARPVVTISASNTVVCSGSPVTLSGQGAHIYIWSGGITNGVPFNPISNATYSLTGKDSLTGCTSTNSAVQLVQVKPLPLLSISQRDSVICAGDTTMLTGSGAATYAWNTGESTPNIIIAPLTTTSFTISGTGVNGCTNSAVITQSVSDCVGTIERTFSEPLSIYPNPGRGHLFIRSSRNIVVLVSDGLGKRILQVKVEGGVVQEADISSYAKGVYYLSSPDVPGWSEKIISTD
jgi:hypothetical protein